MVRVKQGIPTQTSGSKARVVNHHIIPSLSPRNKPSVRLSAKVTSCCLQRLPVARYQEAKLEVITDCREAQVWAMKTISVSSLNSNENVGSENKERGGFGESVLQDEMSLRNRLRPEVKRWASDNEAKLYVAGVQQWKRHGLGWRVLELKDVVSAR